jgi:hypothetical protein
LRYSVSWKALCFADERERSVWRDHVDDLPVGEIEDRLVGELVNRGRLPSPDEQPPNQDLAFMMIDEFIHFPRPESQAASTR